MKKDIYHTIVNNETDYKIHLADGDIHVCDYCSISSISYEDAINTAIENGSIQNTELEILKSNDIVRKDGTIFRTYLVVQSLRYLNSLKSNDTVTLEVDNHDDIFTSDTDTFSITLSVNTFKLIDDKMYFDEFKALDSIYTELDNFRNSDTVSDLGIDNDVSEFIQNVANLLTDNQLPQPEHKYLDEIVNYINCTNTLNISLSVIDNRCGYRLSHNHNCLVVKDVEDNNIELATLESLASSINDILVKNDDIDNTLEFININIGLYKTYNITKSLIVMVGYPGCGKSSYINKLERKNEYNVIGFDKQITDMFPGKSYDYCIGMYNKMSDDEKQKLRDITNDMFYELLAKGENIIIDMTNLSIARRRKYITPAKELGYTTNIVEFETTIEECMSRKRDHKHIPDETYTRMFIDREVVRVGEADLIFKLP